MKKQASKQINPTKLALLITTILSTTAFFATILILISPNTLTITPLLKILYGPFGYNISLIGSLLGAIYIGIDTFILTWLFAWLYNKLL